MYTLSVHLKSERRDMKATFLDLRKRSKEIAKALDRNQTITLYYRGKIKGMIVPASKEPKKILSVMDHPFFGMWRDREDMKDVQKWIDEIRKPRHDF